VISCDLLSNLMNNSLLIIDGYLCICNNFG